jgi:hypothetical protein
VDELLVRPSGQHAQHVARSEDLAAVDHRLGFGGGITQRALDRLPAVRACLSVPSTLPCAWRQACADRDVRGALAVVPVQLPLQPRRSRHRRWGHLASTPAGDGDPDVPRDRPRA